MQKKPIAADKFSDFRERNNNNRISKNYNSGNGDLDVRYWYIPQALVILTLTVYATGDYFAQDAWIIHFPFVNAENYCRVTFR